MTPEKILEVVGKYETLLNERGVEPLRWPDVNPHLPGLRLQHLAYMADEIRAFVAAGRIEKAFRWLGFMQGVLWADGYFTVDELGRHNMPAEEKSA